MTEYKSAMQAIKIREKGVILLPLIVIDKDATVTDTFFSLFFTFVKYSYVCFIII